MGYSYIQFFKDLYSFIKPYKTKFFFASFFRFVFDVLALYVVYLISRIIEILASTGTVGGGEELMHIVLILFFINLVHQPILQIAFYNGFWIAEKTSIDARLEGTKKLTEVDMAWHEKSSSGVKFNQVLRGSKCLDEIIRLWFMFCIEIVTNFVGVITIITILDYKIALLLLLFVVLYITIFRYTSKATQETHKEVVRQEDHVTGSIVEITNNIRTVKNSFLAKPLLISLRKDLDVLIVTIKQRIVAYRKRDGGVAMFVDMFRLFLMWIVLVGIIDGLYTAGFFVIVYMYFTRLHNATRDISHIAEKVMTQKINFLQLRDLLALKTPQHDAEKNEFPASWESITMSNVSFSYQNEENVLHDINLVIKNGEKIGIVGSSGSGKSTLFKLLLKERNVYEGSVSINGIDIRTITQKSYFANVSSVLQETEVFNLSLRENIAIGDQRKIDEERLGIATSVSHVDDFVEMLPQGMDTIIGEKGMKLSGGQRQRLGIARALYKKPQILLLDEATSHLDVETEERIKDSLQKFFENVTAIVVAHRLSTIKLMDRIIVIENGTIVEQGTFDELRTKKGRFSELWDKQLF